MEEILHFALAGPPNCGKTTLFNRLTGSSLQVGNWPGVTVEKKTGVASFENLRMQFTDLPGICALSPWSPEEKVASDFLHSGEVQGIIAVVDALAPQRGLYLLSQLMELHLPILVILNRTDMAEREGFLCSPSLLSRKLGMPVIAVSSSKGDRRREILTACRNLTKQSLSPKIFFPPENDYAEEAAARYDWAEGVLGQCSEKLSSRKLSPSLLTDKLDTVFLSKYFGYPILILILCLVFFLSFGPLAGCLETSGLLPALFSAAQKGLSSLGAEPWLQGLLLDGMLAGVGAALSFLPGILLLFFCLALLEDTGYMARAAFLLDAPLSRLGLSGKSVVPIVSGFGCTVPATLSTRILEREEERRRTLRLLPFLSCSAKTPVYLLIASALFPKQGAWIVGGLCAVGLLCALIAAFLMKKSGYGENGFSPFVMELPPYTCPTLRSVWNRVKQRAADFFSRVVSVLLWACALVWLLESISPELQPVTDPEKSLLAFLGKGIAPVFAPCGFSFWQAAVALLAGLPAKENIAGTLAVLLPGAALTVSFSPLSGLSFLIFVLLYSPCAAALSAYKKEAGSLHRAIGMAVSQSLLAWAVSALFFQIGSLFL